MKRKHNKNKKTEDLSLPGKNKSLEQKENQSILD